MFCKNCGSEIQEGGSFCPRCGAAQNDSVQSPQNAQAQLPPPNNHMVKNIIGLFLCWPFAVAGLIFAAKVDNLWRSGYFDEARKYASKANLWGNVSIWVGIISIVLVVLFYVFIFGTFAILGSGALYDI